MLGGRRSYRASAREPCPVRCERVTGRGDRDGWFRRTALGTCGGLPTRGCPATPTVYRLALRPAGRVPSSSLMPTTRDILDILPRDELLNLVDKHDLIVGDTWIAEPARMMNSSIGRLLRAFGALALLLPACGSHAPDSSTAGSAGGSTGAGAGGSVGSVGGGTTSGSSGSSGSSGAPSTATAGAPGAPMAPVYASGASITPTGTIWYVRSDGGTPAQCEGKTDHALAGASGNNCAFSDPAYLWSNDVAGETAQWKIAGGDTVILHQGPYRIGYKSNTGTAQDAWGYLKFRTSDALSGQRHRAGAAWARQVVTRRTGSALFGAV
jgi:hypothetical protein